MQLPDWYPEELIGLPRLLLSFASWKVDRLMGAEAQNLFHETEDVCQGFHSKKMEGVCSHLLALDGSCEREKLLSCLSYWPFGLCYFS